MHLYFGFSLSKVKVESSPTEDAEIADMIIYCINVAVIISRCNPRVTIFTGSCAGPPSKFWQAQYLLYGIQAKVFMIIKVN